LLVSREKARREDEIVGAEELVGIEGAEMGDGCNGSVDVLRT
jgi:hypothetical protein